MEYEPNEAEKRIAEFLNRRSKTFRAASRRMVNVSTTESVTLRRVSEEYSDAAEAVLSGNYLVRPFKKKETNK